MKQVLNGKVLFRMQETEVKTTSGILIAPASQTRKNVGTVILTDFEGVNIGDEIIFDPLNIAAISDNEYIIDGSDIWGIV